MKSLSNFNVFQQDIQGPQTLPSIRNLINITDLHANGIPNTTEGQSNYEPYHQALKPQHMATAALAANHTCSLRYQTGGNVPTAPNGFHLEYSTSSSSGSPTPDSDTCTGSTDNTLPLRSRHSSIETLPSLVQTVVHKPQTRRNARNRDRQHRRAGPSDVRVPSTIRHRNDAKNQNERDQRHVLQTGCQNIEDIIQIVGGIGDTAETEHEYGNVQTSGNGASSGLKFAKASTLDIAAMIILHFFEKELGRTFDRGGSREDFHAQNRRIVCASKERQDEDVLSGTLLDGEHNSPCATSETKGDKTCVNHRHSNWTDCRKDRRRSNFESNVQNMRFGPRDIASKPVPCVRRLTKVERR